MEQSPQQVLEQLQTNYREYHRSITRQWATPEDKSQAKRALEDALRAARRMTSTLDTRVLSADQERVKGELVVWSTLAESDLKV